MDFAGAIYESPISGMSSFLVLGKMVRLIGADIVVFPAPYGKAPIIKDKYMAIARALRYRLGDLKPTLPMPSGGITPGMVLEVMKDLGADVLIGSGGGIHAHPDGSIAGARAFRQAIDIGMKHMEEASEDFEDYVEDNEDDYPELARAMEEWGIKETKFA
ncbi:MAG: RuBisCO large subunit C-terminal-like domain-containing protein [Candidatus Hodarchaeales archaeon]